MTENDRSGVKTAASGGYTPGPWVARDEGDGLPASVFDATVDEQFIAEVYGRGDGEHLRNARLIATAPEMHAFIQLVADRFEGTDAPLGQLASHILAKARGETP